MKKTSNFPKFVLAALSCFSFMLSGCNNNSSNNDNVTIILSKKSTTLVVGAEQTLKLSLAQKELRSLGQVAIPLLFQYLTSEELKPKKLVVLQLPLQREVNQQNVL